jgi:carbon storage regulator
MDFAGWVVSAACRPSKWILPWRVAKTRPTQKEAAMLVITRKIGETIVIDGNIRVTVVAHQGGKIRLGIEAPEYVSVDRQEVHDRKMQELDACPEGQGFAIAR